MTPALWVIVDDVMGQGEHRCLLMWHLLNGKVNLNSETGLLHWRNNEREMQLQVYSKGVRPDRLEVLKGNDNMSHIQGWASEFYGSKEAIPVLEAEFNSELPLRIVTIAGFDTQFPKINQKSRHLEITTPQMNWKIELFPVVSDSHPIIKSISISKDKGRV